MEARVSLFRRASSSCLVLLRHIMQEIDSSSDVPPVRLNYDVLCVMLQNIGDRRTLSRLMRTCHELYTQGVPLLLDVDVVRLNLDNSESLDCYLKRDVARYKYLRRLQITMFLAGYMQQQPMDALATTVQRASNLAELSIDRNALQLSPTLLNTVARLKTIEVLSINGVSTIMHNMLRAMQSPVRELKISIVSVAGYANLVPSLSRLSSTLEKLEINYSQWPSRAHPDVIFPGVSSLRLDVYEPETSVADLMYMMPNLQRLYTYQEAALADPDRIRRANLTAQDTIGPCPWRSLDYASASLNSLYSLAPRCHIRHLALSSIQSGKTDTSRVRDVLAAAHPTCVSLDLMCMKQANCDFASLFGHAPSSVTRLNLNVQLPATSPVKDHVVRLLWCAH